jgi:hypothetical protein
MVWTSKYECVAVGSPILTTAYRNPDIHQDKNLGNSFSSMKSQMTISANMIVSIFIMFGIGYMIGKTISDDETTVSTRILFLFPAMNYRVVTLCCRE